MTLYDRQKNLNLSIPESVTIIGVGGVGSWVVLDLALVGVKNMLLIDPDEVEESNLNRTPFKTSQIGEPKVSAISELIYERRPDISLTALQSRLEDVLQPVLDNFKESVVVDCRDTVEPIPPDMANRQFITGGYDGDSVTIHINPKYDSIFSTTDEPVRYTVTPSFVAPPQLIAALVTAYITSPNTHKVKEEVINTFSIYDLLRRNYEKYQGKGNVRSKEA